MVSEKIQCNHVKENGEQCGNKKLRKNIPRGNRDNWKCHQHQEDTNKEKSTFDELKQELTEKQKVFADEYIISLNATEAAKKAGYSEKTARQTGSENLSKPYIQQYIHKRLEQKEEERIASQDEVLEYLTKVMRAEEEEVDVFFDKTGREREIRQPPKIKDRIKAAELLGKRYAIFVEKQELDINEIPTINLVRGKEDES